MLRGFVLHNALVIGLIIGAVNPWEIKSQSSFGKKKKNKKQKTKKQKLPNPKSMFV